MARLIDADALKKFPIRIDHYDKEHGNTDFVLGIETVLEYAEHLPTVDAVPVVHGRWFSLTDCSNAGVYCSVCHKKVWKEDYAWCNRKNRLRSNYCPNCGAHMDWGEEA